MCRLRTDLCGAVRSMKSHPITQVMLLRLVIPCVLSSQEYRAEKGSDGISEFGEGDIGMVRYRLCQMICAPVIGPRWRRITREELPIDLKDINDKEKKGLQKHAYSTHYDDSH
eukprot:scaffold1064_cov85-Amphora_coffeaeformis.AAC.3